MPADRGLFYAYLQYKMYLTPVHNVLYITPKLNPAANQRETKMQTFNGPMITRRRSAPSATPYRSIGYAGPFDDWQDAADAAAYDAARRRAREQAVLDAYLDGDL